MDAHVRGRCADDVRTVLLKVDVWTPACADDVQTLLVGGRARARTMCGRCADDDINDVTCHVT